MFNKDFFPTPVHVIDTMLHGVDIHGKSFLEPSAGKGNIVDYLNLHGAGSVISCEINPDLQKILFSKSRVISNDFFFLKAEDISHIDCIIMNPPFSADEKHILHAFDIAPKGCKIIALCNYETYNNPSNNYRKRLKAIINENGCINNLGPVFSDSERETNVHIGLINITKPGISYSAEFEGFYMDESDNEQQADGIISYNAIRDMVNRVVSAVKMFDKQIELGIQMAELTGIFGFTKIAFTCSVDGAGRTRDEFKKEVMKNAWSWLFKQMNMDKYTTNGLKRDINKFVEDNSNLPFTMKNAYKMLETVIGTTASRMDRALVEVFEKITSHYDENKYNVPGWKTNSHYMVNEKFILDYCTSIGWKGEMKARESYYSNNIGLMQDMIKAMCYITGTQYDNIVPLDRFVEYRYKLKSANGYLSDWKYVANKYEEIKAVQDKLHNEGIITTIVDLKPEWGQWFEWGFFKVRGYKKGTMHFVFKDRKQWELFNRQVARIKGYPLPEAI